MKHPLRRGFSLVPGSLTIILLRVLLLLLGAVPAWLVTWYAFSSSLARQPYYTEVAGRLPIFHLFRLYHDLPALLLPAVLFSLVLTVLGEQILIAGALAWLDPGRAPAEGALAVAEKEGSCWRAVLRRGTQFFWRMLRVLLVATILAAAGLYGFHCAFAWLALYGERAEWTGRTMVLYLPLAKLLVSTLWLALVGSWALWLRLLVVSEQRSYLRTAGVLVLRLFGQRPLVTLVIYPLVSVAVMLGSGALLFCWRQYPPQSLLGLAWWASAWLGVLCTKAYLWYWLIRAGRLIYMSPKHDSIRQQPDQSWGVLKLLREIYEKYRPQGAK